MAPTKFRAGKSQQSDAHRSIELGAEKSANLFFLWIPKPNEAFQSEASKILAEVGRKRRVGRLKKRAWQPRELKAGSPGKKTMPRNGEDSIW